METTFSTRLCDEPSRCREWRCLGTVLFAGLLLAFCQSSRAAPAKPDPDPAPTYADIADLADSAKLVLRVEVRKQAVVEPARATTLRPGTARLYIQARTQALLVGARPVGEDLAWLVDLPLDARGKPPALKHAIVIAFAREVPGRPFELQLVAPDGQVPWTAATESRLHGVLGELRAPDAPGHITGVREAMYVPGTLAGSGETQISLTTAEGAPASISITREPGQPPVWAVSFGEVFDNSGKPPPRDTLAWYRLACFLPRTLPESASVSGSTDDRAHAAADYGLVIEGLGPCSRTRG